MHTVAKAAALILLLLIGFSVVFYITHPMEMIFGNPAIEGWAHASLKTLANLVFLVGSIWWAKVVLLPILKRKG